MKEKLPLKREFSAGGVVFKKEGGQIQVLVVQHSGHKGWVFPKGLIEKGEKSQDTAIREVEEEAGVKAKALKRLAPIQYFYVQKGYRIFKTATFFLMKYLSGNVADHDWEAAEAVWVPDEEVEDRLSFETEKKVWKEARSLIASSR